MPLSAVGLDGSWEAVAAFVRTLAFVVIDYITGIMCAIVDKPSSAVGFKGIFGMFGLLLSASATSLMHRLSVPALYWYCRHFLLHSNGVS